MKALNAAVGLRVVWSRVQLVDLQKVADFTEQFRTEFRPVVDKKPARRALPGEDLTDYSTCMQKLMQMHISSIAAKE